MDWVSDKDTGLLGIESLAIDPSSPNKLSLSAGIACLNSGASAILKSGDSGAAAKSSELRLLVYLSTAGRGIVYGKPKT